FLIKQLLIDFPNMRVLITAPNRELIDQDIKELLKIWSDAPIGINCDGLGSRDTAAHILFATINSIYRNPQAIGRRDLVIIDEAHFIPHHDQGTYRATLDALRELVPDLRVAGLTATPYRLDSGHLCEGNGHIFDSAVYEYRIAQGIRDNVLSPLSSKATVANIDVSGVGKRGGEFITDQLEAAAIRMAWSNAPATRSPPIADAVVPGWSTASVLRTPPWYATHCARALSIARWSWAKRRATSAIASSKTSVPVG